MSDGEKPFFPPARGREPYRAAERVTPTAEPPPKRVVATLAEPPPSKNAAPEPAGLSLEKRIARDMARNDELANEWAKRVAWRVAIRIVATLVVLLVVSVLAFLRRR